MLWSLQMLPWAFASDDVEPVPNGAGATSHPSAMRRSLRVVQEGNWLFALTQSLIALGLLALIAILVLQGKTVDNAVYAILSAVVGFYYGQKQAGALTISDPGAGQVRQTDRR